MTSGAFGDLSNRLSEVRVLAGLDPTRDPAAAANASRSNAVNRGCILLLSAHMEGYLEDLAAEALDVLVTAGTRVERLPLLLRALHAETHLGPLQEVRDRNARATKIERLFSDEAALWVAGTIVQQQMLRTATVLGEMSNPGSREIKMFLRLLDVEIEGVLDAVGDLQLLGRINGLIAKRNQIAHGELNATATAADVDAYLLLIASLSIRIDAAVADAVKTTAALSALPW